jgi:hypothetical protein
MANDFSGRIWRITAAGTTPFGSLNVKFKSIIWSGMTAAGQTFTLTDAAGRVYTFTSPAVNGTVTISEMGWLESPLTFGGTFTGEVDLFLSGGK